MAYADEAVKFNREPVAIVEIDFRACSLVHGVGACASTATGDNKCYNSYSTCRDRANFAATTKTLRFSNIRIDDLQGDTEAPTFPTLTGLNLSPTVLTPAEGLGIRATCSITLTDHPFTDVGIDPYLSDRTFDPMDRGSFWSKMVTRWPFYTDNVVRVKTGYLEDDGTYDAANFTTRTYFIDTIKGPDEKGSVQISCKDILRQADNAKAQVPTQSRASLTSDITSAATSVDITDPDDDVKGAYDAGQAYVRIDDETMLITNMTGSGPSYTLTVNRASMPASYEGTMSAEEHSAEATVQQCHYFNAEPVDDIIYYLLNTGAGIAASYLPTTDWDDVISFGLQEYDFSALITEPVGVKDLLEEITKHSILLWYDERDGEVKMDSIIRRLDVVGPLDDTDHILSDSVSVNRDDKARISQAWLAFGHRNPVLELDELKSFSSVYVSADVDKEAANEYNQKKVKKIFSRWLPLTKKSVATEITNRLLNYYKDTKNIVTIALDPKDYETWTGDILTMSTRLIQDFTGSTPRRTYRVLQANEAFAMGDVKYKYTLQSTGSIYGGEALRFGLITPNTMGEYSAETEANKARYGFICYNDRGDGEAGFPVNDEAYGII
jgi:hypothetical protein